MAYTQKNNPFKQKVSVDTPPKTSQNNINLAKRLNKMRYEMGHIYPVVSEKQIIKEVNDEFSSEKNKGSYWDDPQNAEKNYTIVIRRVEVQIYRMLGSI